MPLLFNKILKPEIHLFVWSLTESIEELIDIANFDKKQTSILEAIPNEQKQKEHVVSRHLIKFGAKSIGESNPLLSIDQHGKPFLKGSIWQISLTHTVDYIGVVFRKNAAVGIDIEKPQAKMLKVMGRISNESELQHIGLNLDMACIYWSAKEALYKLYGERKVDFKENLKLYWLENQLFGEIYMPNHQKTYKIYHEQIEHYFIVIAY